jgi:hypothetical protein
MVVRVLLAVGLLVALTTSAASATVVARLADFESPTTAPYDIDQTSSNCSGSTVGRDTSMAYTGSASLKVHLTYESSCPALFARGIFNANSPDHLVAGDDFWVGAAIYLPSGFYASHSEYTDLLRVDSYVTDSGTSTSDAQRQYISLSSFSSDAIYMRAVATTGPQNTMVGPLSPSVLPEGRWNWVEMHVKLSEANGAAVNVLKINGAVMGSSTLANVFAGRADYNRIRYGLVSDGGYGSDMTLWVDRASISSSELGPASSTSTTTSPTTTTTTTTTTSTTTSTSGTSSTYAQQVLGTSGLVSYWRLDNLSGTVVTDSKGANSGADQGTPALGSLSLLGTDADAATGFNGSQDRVAVPASSSLNLSSGVSLEAWARASALQGTVLRRNNSYELRMESDGAVMFRVWVGGAVQTLESPVGSVQAGVTYHLVGTYDGTTMRIYRDGTQIASRSQSGSLSNSSSALYLGYNDYSATYFAGTIDEAAIYDRALDAGTVAAHYDAGV